MSTHFRNVILDLTMQKTWEKKTSRIEFAGKHREKNLSCVKFLAKLIQQI